MVQKVEVSYKTIVFTVFFLLLLWFLYQILDIIFSLFVAFIFMSALRPSVEKLESLRVPRGLAIGFLYILIILILSFIGRVIFPPLVEETARFLRVVAPTLGLPAFYQELLTLVKNLNFDAFTKITPYGGNVADVIRGVVSVFGSIVSALSLFVFTFYLLLERQNLGTLLTGILGKERAEKGVVLITRVEERLGAWVRGQFLLCVIIGVVSFIGLYLLRVPYALPLAIIAGILEIVPVIGPIVSAIPAILVALLTSPGLALITAVLYFLIQQAENHLIVPNVMNKVVGLRPVITIVALMIGGKLMGIGGAILAIPVVLVIQSVLQQTLESK